jgi:hypothetical protein
MDASPDVLRKTPDMISALAAVDAASQMLLLASQMLEVGNCPESLEQSRRALRVAASALLFKDGVIAQTFEATAEHIEKSYPKMFPLKDWQEIEKKVTGDGPGLLNLLVRASGRQPGMPDARNALNVATNFLNNVKQLVSL